MKNKKIIFLVPDLTIGGGERVVSELSLNLPDCIERTIVLFKSQVSYPYKGKLVFLNLAISNNFLWRIYCFFLGVWRFKRIIKKERPDWIMSLGIPANLINVLTNQKAILRIDNFLSNACRGLEGKVYKILIRLLFNKAVRIISVSQKAANDLVENFGIKKEKIKVIYNPISIEKIQDLAKEPLESKYQEIFKQPVIITIGRLTEQKGQWHLIRAFKEVKKTKSDLKLVILGEGKLKPYLKELIQQLDLENDVYLLDVHRNPFKFLSRSKLFVFPSLWEGLGIVILEAMTCGLPIVSADCKSGPREILAPSTDINQEAKDIEYAEYGILTPVCDGKFYKANDALTKSEKKISQAIIKTLTNKELSDNLIKRSQQRANDFDIKQIIKEWDFLRSLAPKKL